MPVNIEYSRKVNKVELDPAAFKKGEIKEIKVWSWKRMRNQKYVVCVLNGKLIIQELVGSSDSLRES